MTRSPCLFRCVTLGRRVHVKYCRKRLARDLWIQAYELRGRQIPLYDTFAGAKVEERVARNDDSARNDGRRGRGNTVIFLKEISSGPRLLRGLSCWRDWDRREFR